MIQALRKLGEWIDKDPNRRRAQLILRTWGVMIELWEFQYDPLEKQDLSKAFVKNIAKQVGWGEIDTHVPLHHVEKAIQEIESLCQKDDPRRQSS
jgi:hypothetical protein